MNNTYSRASAWKPILLAFGLVGAASTGARAQLGYPSANASSLPGTYTDLTTGSVISTPNFDDSNSAATDIGFTFSYANNTFTQFVLNTNGFIRLGANAPTTPYFGANSSGVPGGPLASSTNLNIILPFNTDLEAGTGTPEYRVATTGSAPNRVTTIQWRNVSDKARSGGAKQYANISFQVKLYETTNAVEFVYGTATPSNETSVAAFAGVGLKGSGVAANQYITLVKASNTSWSAPTFQDANYVTTANAFNFRNAPSLTGIPPEAVLPDPGRTYHFDSPVANDASVAQLYNIERVPAGQSFVYRAAIRNAGTTALTGLTATLTITGANSTTQTASVGALATGAVTTVSFPSVSLPNVGNNTVTVSIPGDGNAFNNSRTATTVTQATSTTANATFSYIKPNVPFTGGRGYGVSTPPEEYTAAFCAAYTPTAAFRVTTVRAMIYPDDNATNQTVYGVLLDQSGNVLAQSDEYVITFADLGTLHTFTLQTPYTVAAGTTFLAGLAQKVGLTTGYFPMATQDENPQRSGTFFTVVGIDDPPGVVRDITAATTPVNAIFMVEVAGFGTTLSAASPALARAFSLYPNPSNDGQFNLAVRGANAPAGLSVEVVNQLGQRVYNGAARDNFTSSLDLRDLPNGIYFLTLRNGNEYSSSKVSINR